MSFEYNDKRSLLMRELQKIAISEQVFKSCINCVHWKHNGIDEICELNKLRPPAEIIVFGCELHDFDIPF